MNSLNEKLEKIIEEDILKIQLVQMNPQNQVNYKLTLNVKKMKESNLLKEELSHLIGYNTK